MKHQKPERMKTKRKGRKKSGGWIVLIVLCLAGAGIIYLRGTGNTDNRQKPDDTVSAEEHTEYSAHSEETELTIPPISGVFLPAQETEKPGTAETPSPVSTYRPEQEKWKPAESNDDLSATEPAHAAPSAAPAEVTASPAQPSAAPSPAPPGQGGTGSGSQPAPSGENETPRI